ncbi:MAG: hypothetical protein V3S31_05980 [Dehalococcoidia bacterium]
MTSAIPPVNSSSFSIAPLQPLRSTGTTPSTRVGSGPAYRVLISSRARAAASEGIAARRAALELLTLRSVDDALTAVAGGLRDLAGLAAAAQNTKLTSADRLSFGRQLVSLKRQVDRVAADGLNDVQLVPGLDVSTGVATGTAGTVRVGAVLDRTRVTSIDASGATADTSYVFSRSGKAAAGANELGGVTLTETKSGASQSIALPTVEAGDGTTELSFDELGVSVTLDSPGVSAGDLAGALDGQTIATVAKTELEAGANADAMDGSVALAAAAVASLRQRVAAGITRLKTVAGDIEIDPSDRPDASAITETVLRSRGLLGATHVGVNGVHISALVGGR